MNRKGVAERFAALGFGCDVWTDPPGQVLADFVHGTLRPTPDEQIVIVGGREPHRQKHRNDHETLVLRLPPGITDRGDRLRPVLTRRLVRHRKVTSERPRWMSLKVPGDTMVFWWPAETDPTYDAGRAMDMAVGRYTELYGEAPEAEIVGKLAMVNDLEADD